DIALYQAQTETAREKEISRANAHACQLLSEDKGAAKANAALLDAQALDIRAVNSAEYPEILEHRYRQKVLASLEAVAAKLPQIVSVGAAGAANIDFSEVARQMLGIADQALFSKEDVQKIRDRVDEISARISEREDAIATLLEPPATAAAMVEEGGAS
ncbi:MAG: SPFH domain-containing protein, partial [bacterium]|nr:SPFH domain-containing protein [bacterium]